MCFGGASAGQNATQQQTQNISTMLSGELGTRLGQQNTTVNELTNLLNDNHILPGWSPEQLAAENTQAINSTAAASRNAQQAAATAGAGAGSSSGLESGVQKQIQGSIASSAANNLADKQLAITNADYNAGVARKQQTESGLATLSGIENPEGWGGAALGANNQNFSQETKINQENAQAKASALAAGLSLASGVAGGIGNLDTTGGSSMSEQFGNFLTGFGG